MSLLLRSNHVDLYEIWSVSAKNKCTAHPVSCLPSLSVLCCNPPSCSFHSPYFLLFIYTSRFTSLPLTQLCLRLIYTFQCFLSGFSFAHRSNYCFSLIDMCMFHACQRSRTAMGSQLCKNSAFANKMLECFMLHEERAAARNRSF